MSQSQWLQQASQSVSKLYVLSEHWVLSKATECLILIFLLDVPGIKPSNYVRRTPNHYTTWPPRSVKPCMVSSLKVGGAHPSRSIWSLWAYHHCVSELTSSSLASDSTDRASMETGLDWSYSCITSSSIHHLLRWGIFALSSTRRKFTQYSLELWIHGMKANTYQL